MTKRKSVKQRMKENKNRLQKEEEKVCPHCGDPGCAGAVYHPEDCPFLLHPENKNDLTDKGKAGWFRW